MNRVLRVGDTSVRVAEARATLARLGLLSDFKGELSAWKKQKYSESDKSFDANLSEVLKAFQQSRGIVPTGEIDDLTLRELRQASYTLGSRVLSYEPANELVGDDISQLQQQLQELGFYQQRVDGHFGTNTHAALKEYQHNCGLQEDGVCAARPPSAPLDCSAAVLPVVPRTISKSVSASAMPALSWRASALSSIPP